MTDYKNKYIKYKIKYLNLVGGVNPQEIDLLSCTKFSLFTKKNLKEGEYFTAESFSQKRKVFIGLDITKCYEIKLDPVIKAICTVLYKLVDQLNDFVEFIKIFGEHPYKKSVLVKEITDIFNTFSFKFNSHDLLSFLVKFLLFLQELINKIKFLFEQILKNADYDSTFELNLINFKYFSINFEDYNVFHNKTYVYCPIFFNVFKQCYLNIFKLIDELKTVFNSNIEILLKMFKENFNVSINTLKLSDGNLQSNFAAYETRLRAGIGNICLEIGKFLPEQDCGSFKTLLSNFCKLFENKGIYNQTILDKFFNIIEHFKTDTKCTKDNKLKIYYLLNKLGVILKFLSIPEKQKEIDIKISEAFKSLEFIDKGFAIIKGERNYIDDLKKQLVILEDTLKKCVSYIDPKYPTDPKKINPIHIAFNEFKDIQFANIDETVISSFINLAVQVENFTESSCIFGSDKLTKKELKTKLDKIREILKIPKEIISAEIKKAETKSPKAEKKSSFISSLFKKK